MQHRPSLRKIPWFLLIAVLAAAAPATSQETGAPFVTAAVQVTQDPNPSRAHASPQIARNPRTGELVIAATEFRTTKTCNVFISVDDGRSWFPGGSPALEPFTDCGDDPISAANLTLQFDRDGALYLAHTAHDPAVNDGRPRNERPLNVLLARSTDSGRSFETTMVYQPPAGATPADGRLVNRRPFVAVDPKDPAKVYLSWQQAGGTGRPDRALIASSKDGGRTFGAPVEVGDDRGAYQARPAVDGNGVVHIVTPTRGQSLPTTTIPPAPGDATTSSPPTTGAPAATTTTLAAIRPTNYRSSSDQGATWTEIREIDPGNAGFSFGRKQLLVADPDSDALYFAWYGNRNPRAQRPPSGNDDREIFLRVSTDGGATWSDAKEVNDEASTPNIQHYDPGMAVAPNGRLDIAWFDFRHSPAPEGEGPGGNDGGANDVYYTYSTDQGRTLARNIRISDRTIDRTIGVWSNNVHIHAHVGVASSGDAAYFAWQDTRNGNPEFQSEDIYFASARFSERAASDTDEDGMEFWMLFVAGALLGMGVAMAVVIGAGRRREERAAS